MPEPLDPAVAPDPSDHDPNDPDPSDPDDHAGDDVEVAPRLGASDLDRLLAGVAAADETYRRAWPGPPRTRQPVQVLYVPADRVGPGTAHEHGAEALRLLHAHAPDVGHFADATGILDVFLADEVRARVATRLATGPVDDLRVDFEDGYLGRSEAEEARDAVAAARSVASAVASGDGPPFVGLRVKSFTDGLARRSVATLDRFVGTLLDRLGHLPDGFVITFPKIIAVDHVRAFVEVLASLEAASGLQEGRLRFEVQIETTPSVLGPDGAVALRAIRDAGAGRIVAAHLGVYDYTAGLGLPPGEQRLEHPACDFVRHLLQVSFAGTEVRLSDGSSNAVPAEDTAAELHRVWSAHAATVRHSLAHGYVQGWDLHPSHLVSRYATVYADLLRGFGDVLERLRRWYEPTGAPGTDPEAADGAAGSVMDEPATIRRLEAHVQRAVDAGAATSAEVAARTGRTVTPRPATLLPPDPA
jgi:hypothetical protein